jgi:simple sugar transport system ATP-binding protein
VRDATFTLSAGEIVGVAAVEGSGQYELLRLLAGRIAPAAGTLERPARVAFIPEDRQRDALLVDASLAENLALAGAGARRGRVAWRAMAERAAALVAAFDVRGGGPGTAAAALSGGNQQKFVVARELAGDAAPALVVAENPTRGLDIRASAAVRTRLRAARDAGAAVVVYSSDLEEVLALADRVLVVYDGRVLEAARDREVVGRLMLGAVG